MIIFNSFDTKYHTTELETWSDIPSVILINTSRGGEHIRDIWELLSDVYFDRDNSGFLHSMECKTPFTAKELEVIHEFIRVLFSKTFK